MNPSPSKRQLRPSHAFSLTDFFRELKYKYRIYKFKNLTPAFDSGTNIFSFDFEGNRFLIKTPDVRDFISFNIIRHRTFYDIADLNQARPFIRKGSVVIDAGANIGNHALYYAKVCQAGRVLSFEPQEHVFSILQENIRLNELDGTIIPYRLAVGDQNTRAAVDFRDDHQVSKRLAQTNHGGVYLKEETEGAFEVRTLDSLFLDSLDRLDFIKMDIQGFEAKAVRGGRRLIAKFKPVIQLECMTGAEYETVLKPLMAELNYRLKQKLNIDYIFEPV